MEGIDFERTFMNDYWSFRKKFYEVQDSDEYWNAVINESNELANKYDRHCYLVGLLLQCVDDLEYRYRQQYIGKNPNITFVPGEVSETIYKRIQRKRKEEAS